MEIILIRHGKPAFDMGKKFRQSRLATELDAYDAAGLAVDSEPPQALYSKLQQSIKVFSSDLQRALESAAKIVPEADIVTLPLFREAPLPRRLPIPLRLSASTWAVIARTLWLLGYSGGVESHRQARLRATAATRKLIELAHNGDNIVLVGHGFINLFIAKQLLNQGWRGPKKPESCYWGCSVYQYV